MGRFLFDVHFLWNDMLYMFIHSSPPSDEIHNDELSTNVDMFIQFYTSYFSVL